MCLPAPVVSSSVGVPSSSVRVARAAILSVLALRPALQVFRQVAGQCIPRALRQAAHRVAVPALALVRVDQVAVLASVSVLAWVVVPPVEALCPLRARRRARSVRAVRHVAVAASSTPRPKKAR